MITAFCLTPNIREVKAWILSTWDSGIAVLGLIKMESNLFSGDIISLQLDLSLGGMYERN
ncbi:hypothetical protein D7I46_10335 [Lactococcus allomyrinae]|uniref:Uncharacterized protein n=1 Tax=Lactococcus allomyrinae TaxID=2419773 RepID=A0A387BGZ2_9LACT|nr:hypothetical protein D7I46_10335 [Lactococcus allomyrinae]